LYSDFFGFPKGIHCRNENPEIYPNPRVTAHVVPIVTENACAQGTGLPGTGPHIKVAVVRFRFGGIQGAGAECSRSNTRMQGLSAHFQAAYFQMLCAA
jgi:hypothetical protein